jgi:CHC2 zinc finger/Toprim domain
MLDIDKARAVRIEDVIAERNIKLSPGRVERCGPCPSCGGTDRFSINTRKQVFNCRRCGAKGDVIALVEHLDGVGFKMAVETLGGKPAAAGWHDGLGRCIPTPQKITSEPDNEIQRIASARHLWNEANPIDGTMAARYLQVTRGLAINEDLSHAVRFHDRTPWLDERGGIIRMPCLISAIRSIYGDEIVAIQKTKLAADGSKLARKMLGPAGAGAIKIDRDEDVTYGLIIGEGLETCLAACELGFRPCWALGSAGAIACFPVLDGVDALTLLAETDDSGASARAVDVCGNRWRDASREVIVVYPRSGGDINDAILEVAR